MLDTHTKKGWFSADLKAVTLTKSMHSYIETIFNVFSVAAVIHRFCSMQTSTQARWARRPRGFLRIERYAHPSEGDR